MKGHDLFEIYVMVTVKGIRNMWGIIDIAVRQTWAYICICIYLLTPHIFSFIVKAYIWLDLCEHQVPYLSEGGKHGGVWKMHVRWWLQKCLAHCVLNTCPWGGCLYYVPGSVPLSKTDGVLTWMVFILSGWLLKFKPLLLFILVLLCRIIDVLLMVEYMVNLRWTFRKRDCSHDSNLLSVIST